jgi:DegV family protein with EDD domain
VSCGIVVDSSASLPPWLAEKYGITVVPVTIQRGASTYRDGCDLTTEQFYDLLAKDPPLKTSQPSPGDFITAYRSLKSRFQSIVSIHVTAKASGTCQAAMLARTALPEMDIEVVDSGTTSMALGFIAIAAACAASVGRTKQDILRVIQSAKERVHVYVALSTLNQLRRSGKIGLGQSLIGSLLSVKPVLTMREGMLEVCDRVRTYPRAFERVVDLIVDAAGESTVKLAVIYSKTRAEAVRLASVLQTRLKCSEVFTCDIGAALAVHGGPGMIGAAIMKLPPAYSQEVPHHLPGLGRLDDPVPGSVVEARLAGQGL